MSKMDDAQKKAKKILEDMEKTSSHTEVNVESHSESIVTGGSVNQGSRIDELTADLQRVQAEFINFRRRAELERAEVMDFATSRVVREFLAVRDSFDQELVHRPAEMDARWAASIDSIRSQFDKSLKNLGVERFESLGHVFDPHRHEAITMQDGDGAHEVVVQEVQPGYAIGETVLRHAMVIVGHSDKLEASGSEDKQS
jgi:molecular chaperone GrpE